MLSTETDATYVANNLLEITWVDSDPTLVVRSYNGDTTITEVTDTALLRLIEYTLQPRSIKEIETKLLKEVEVTPETAADVFTTAVDADILLTEDESETQRERTSNWFEKNWRRGLLFYLYSYGVHDSKQVDPSTTTSSQSLPPEGKRHQLPDTETASDVPLRRVLLERRSHRDFGADAISRVALATILSTVTSPINDGISTDGTDSKTSTFVQNGLSSSTITFIAARVDDIDPGVYRYLPETHEIATITHLESRDAADELVQSLANGQEFGVGAAVTFLPSLHYPTYMKTADDWQHGWMGYQALSTVAQRLLFAATARGLQTWMTVALEESDSDAVADIKWPEEAVLSLISVGTAATTSQNKS